MCSLTPSGSGRAISSLPSSQLTEKHASCNMRGNLYSSVEVWRAAEGVEVWGASEAYAGGVGGGASTLWDLVECQVCGSAEDEARMILCDVCDGGTSAVRPAVHQYFLNALPVLIARLGVSVISCFVICCFLSVCLTETKITELMEFRVCVSVCAWMNTTSITFSEFFERSRLSPILRGSRAKRGARRRLDMSGMRQEEPESQLQCCSGWTKRQETQQKGKRCH
jgi:hypothetical protein